MPNDKIYYVSNEVEPKERKVHKDKDCADIDNDDKVIEIEETTFSFNIIEHNGNCKKCLKDYVFDKNKKFKKIW